MKQKDTIVLSSCVLLLLIVSMIIYIYYPVMKHTFHPSRHIKLANETIIVCIPCTKYHSQYLHQAFHCLEKQSRRPDTTIVSISEVDNPNKISLPNTNLDIHYIYHPEKRNAAMNRNSCIDYIEQNNIYCDYVCFMDADDYYYNGKIKEMIQMMKYYNADIGLHEYSWNKNIRYPVNRNILLTETLRQMERDTRKDIDKSWFLSTIPHLPHGYPTVKYHVLNHIRFDDEMDYGEDSKFVRQCIQYGFDVVFYNKPLIQYKIENSHYNNILGMV